VSSKSKLRASICRHFAKPPGVIGNFSKMHIKQKDFEIEIFPDNLFEEDSSDNINCYENIYMNNSEFQPSTKIGIKIFRNHLEIKSVIIISEGGATGISENSFVMNEDKILICCGCTIFCLSIPNLELEWKTKADEITCFGILKHKEDYIIHGELEISKLNSNGKILWSNSGADIFVTLNDENNLILFDKYLTVKDFENRTYKFSYSGENFTDMKQFEK
jgi:hypothetical protein